MDSINTKEPYDTIKNILGQSLDVASNDIALQLRLKLAFIDYLYNQNSKEYKTEMRSVLDSCYEDLAKLEKSDTPKVIKEIVKFLLYGIDYRVTGNISKGTESVKIIDNGYKNNSDNEEIMLLYAQRKAEAPLIGGGDTKLATKVLLSLLDGIEKHSKAFQFAVYSELCYVYQKSDKAKAEYYKQKAAALY